MKSREGLVSKETANKVTLDIQTKKLVEAVVNLYLLGETENFSVVIPEVKAFLDAEKNYDLAQLAVTNFDVMNKRKIPNPVRQTNNDQHTPDAAVSEEAA